jgi:hypothetical protein
MMVREMMNDIGQGYALIATHSGAGLYTVTTAPEGAIYTGVTLDELAQVYRLHSDKVTMDMMPMDWPNGVPSECG